MCTLPEISNLRQPEAPPQARALPGDAHAIARILVCVDLSKSSEACLGHAIAAAKSLGGAITLLHVIQPCHERAGLQATDVLDWEISRQEAGAYLERLEHEGTHALGRPVEIRLEQGHPADRIRAVALELDADLTVLGGPGEGGAASSSGSTVQQVLAAAHGSMLIARSSSAATAEVSPKRILVPLDGSLQAESVLPTAVRIAKTHAAELLLVFVVQEPVPTGVLRAPEDLQLARDLATRLEASGKRYLDGLRDQLVREGTAARTLVLRNADERQSLVDLSRKELSDLIVLSAHGSTCNPGLIFGSVTGHILTHSVVPLLILQDLRDSELRMQGNDRRAPSLRASYSEGV